MSFSSLDFDSLSISSAPSTPNIVANCFSWIPCIRLSNTERSSSLAPDLAKAKVSSIDMPNSLLRFMSFSRLSLNRLRSSILDIRSNLLLISALFIIPSTIVPSSCVDLLDNRPRTLNELINLLASVPVSSNDNLSPVVFSTPMVVVSSDAAPSYVPVSSYALSFKLFCPSTFLDNIDVIFIIASC